MKKSLEKIRNYDRDVELLRREIDVWERRDTTEETAAIVRELEAKIHALRTERNALSRMIDEIGDVDERFVLKHYYIFGDTMAKIAEDLYMSERNVRYIKNDALKSFDEVFV